MKQRTRKLIGNFLIIGIVFLIVLIFSIWYYTKFVRKTSEVTMPVASEEVQNQEIYVLNQEQLEQIANQLNTATNNPFVRVKYQDASKIALSDLFENGAGIATTTVTESEKMQLSEQWKKQQMSNEISNFDPTSVFSKEKVLKLKRTDMEKYVTEKTGIEREIAKNESGIGVYLESEDSYYLVQDDTSFQPISCDEGVLMPNGIFYVKYHYLLDENTKESCTIQMKQENDQFVFLSNLKNEE